MKEMIIVDGKKYFWTNGKERQTITKKQADKLFQQWLAEGKKPNRRYGRVIQCWIE